MGATLVSIIIAIAGALSIFSLGEDLGLSMKTITLGIVFESLVVCTLTQTIGRILRRQE